MALLVLHRPSEGEGLHRVHRPGELRGRNDAGPQPGLVPSDAGHVPGEQRCGRGAERDPQPAGEAGVHHEAGVQPVRTADGAQRADDRTEEAEAADWSAGTPSAHERQPPAARVRLSDGSAYNAYRTECNP